ncbi:MAG: PA14 domain-containing protein [Thermoguttaceae bacterium]|nr:PA14 domain-containing protein [Thermoguttaceae bacterium]MDW8038648.1 PA14 domain-containing protein [Thermoguttaceae bacterium]
MQCFCQFDQFSAKGVWLVCQKAALTGLWAALLSLALNRPASAALIGWWRFEGTPGQSILSVPNAANPGTLDGVPASSAVYSGLLPGAYIYDPMTGNTYSNTASLDMGGSNRYVTIPYNSLLNAASFTIEAFFRVGADQTAYPNYVRRTDYSRGWQLDIDPEEDARARFDTAAATNQVVGSGSAQNLGIGRWNHTAVTFNAATKQIIHYTNYGTTATITLNGEATDITNLTLDLILGQWAAPAGTALDEVRFHDTVLSSSQFLRAIPAPLSSINTSLLGFSTHIVRVNNNLDNMSQTATALTLKPGDLNHSASQVTVVPFADIDLQGFYTTNPAGVLAGDHHSSGATPEDYAVRLAGYVYAPYAGYQRTFAFTADDGWEFRIGGVTMDSKEWPGTLTTYLVPFTFPAVGYYPIDILFRNRSGNAGLEVSSAPGVRSSWNATDFKILGTDPDFPVYQRPEAMPSATDWGPNSAGPAIYTGPLNLAQADGLRVSIFVRGSSFANVQEAISYVWANTPTTTAKSGIIDYYDPQSGSQGSFPNTLPWPHNTSGDDDNFATRVSGALYFPTAGDYAFAVGTDDGFRLRVGNQVIAIYSSPRGHPSGTANVGYIRIPQPGLYPFEFYQYENAGGSSAEISFKRSGDLIFLGTTSRDPAANAFERDLNNNQPGVKAFAVTPKAEFYQIGHELKARIYGQVDALGIGIPVEHWVLHQVAQTGQARIQGLRGYYYQFTGSSQTWDSVPGPTLVGERDDLQSGTFSFGDNYAYGPWGNLEDQFGVRWVGYMEVPITGVYHFYMASDDQSWIYIDINGDGTLESAPSQGVWHNYWYNVELSQGLHRVEFRAREFGGGENSYLYWMQPGETTWSSVPASIFCQNIYNGALLPLTYAVNNMVGSPNWWETLYAFPLGTQGTYRLSAFFAGEWAVVQGSFLFVPEPASIGLLAIGLVGLAFVGARQWSKNRAFRQHGSQPETTSGARVSAGALNVFSAG